ncbi:MAG TPA: ABC transporter substrate-binding protein [Candidatus Polarisedimenticolaceae bacterium]|nr:ABC transporter substrate-binding protein [Candidatus Polarisedimenticolaceae bacterium]
MRIPVVILLLSLAYAGCSNRGAVDLSPEPPTAPAPVPPPESDPVQQGTTVDTHIASPEEVLPSVEPRFGGFIRFLVTDDRTGQAVIHSNVAEGLTPAGMLLSWAEPRGDSTCWTLDLNPHFKFPGGAPVRATDLVALWQRSLDAVDEFGEEQWLLKSIGIEPVSGDGGTVRLAGASAYSGPQQEKLVLCPSFPAPDLLERLSHPALWLVALDDAGSGPGGFWTGDGRVLQRNPNYPRRVPYLDRVEFLRVSGEASLPLRLGDAHVAVVYGKVARELAEVFGDVIDPAAGAPVDEATARPGDGKSIELRRLPSWDRTYYLWMNKTKRWLNDPKFRAWVADVVDRKALLELLFDGQGRVAFSLFEAVDQTAYYPEQQTRPLSQSSSPRLELVYDRDDRHALTIARRFQAVLETADVALALREMDRAAIRAALRDGEIEMAVLAHHPATPDPMLALLGTIWWLGPGSTEIKEALVGSASAVSADEPGQRLSAATALERKLLVDAVLIPLIRLDAVLARHIGLAGLSAESHGVLRFDEAWWLP